MNNKNKNVEKASPANGESTSAFVGRRISSKFDGEKFHGTIDVYDSRRHLWHVHYDDGDEEELDHGEILLAMELFDIVHDKSNKGTRKIMDPSQVNGERNAGNVKEVPIKDVHKKPSPTKSIKGITPFIVPMIVALIASSIWICDKMLVHNASKQEDILKSTGLLKFQPDRFQGAKQKKRYFEGWYYKFVTPLDNSNKLDQSDIMSLAVVPGIFHGKNRGSKESHAFIFVTINGEKQHYYRFDKDEFSYAKSSEDYYIKIADNRFTHSGVTLNLHPRQNDDAHLALHGELTFTNPSPWPVSLMQLGAMGPVGWIPFLECTHGILSFDHILHGSLTMSTSEAGSGVSSSVVSFRNGRGYTEKDYGRSFPSMWVWLQTNSFRNNPGTSLFVSIAQVPVLGLGLPGFTAAVWYNSTLIPFATWSGAKFQDLRVSEDELYIAMSSSSSRWQRNNSGYRVEITVDRRNVPEVLLYAPVNFTKMAPLVYESLQAKVHMRLLNSLGDVLLDDVGDYAGLEVHGNVQWLVDNLCGKKTANKFICL